MKKTILSLAVLMGMCMSCGNQNSGSDSEEASEGGGSTSLKTEQFSVADSLEMGKCEARFSVTADFAVKGKESLRDSINAWVLKMIVGENWTQFAVKENRFDSVLKVMAKSYLDVGKEIFADMQDYEYCFGMSYDADINKVFESKDFVTFEAIGYDYEGGAHGMPFMLGQTFTMKGEPLGWNMLGFGNGNDPEKLNNLIKEAVFKQYFKNDEYGYTEEDIYDYLFIDKYSTFPLPYQQPYLVEGGMKFVYSPYEIGPFSSGEPYCVIPLEELKSLGLLNPTYFKEKAEK